MVERLKKIFKNHKTLIQNFSYLSALQIFNMLLPLITYPYLIRVLGAEQYGLVIYAQVISAYFGILIDFGFRLSTTKDISIFRDDKSKLSEIISSVLTIKLILWIFSLGILFLMVYLIPGFKNEKLLFLFSFAICFNELLFPQWYFQGIEKMKYITIINLTARLIFLALIFIVVKSQSDYLFVPLLNGVGAFIGGLIGLYVIFVKDKLKFRMQPFKNLWFYLRQSSPLFGSYAIISVKDRFNVIFIGSSLGMKEVAIYDLAIKIMGLFMQPIEIVNSTVYPKIAKEKDMKFVVNVSKYLFIGILLMIIAIQPLLSPIINFLGKGLSDAILPTRLMLIAPLIMVWSQGIGRNILLTNGLYKHFSWGMVLTTTFYLLQIGSAFILSINKFLLTFVAITLSTYLFELLYRWIVAKKHDLI